ncbi:hypothetical protein LTR85_012145 [Meristemomyces frigidus]|nr:hypothetical protein LTR85_012145 [Meristemomyces frigidus]
MSGHTVKPGAFDANTDVHSGFDACQRVPGIFYACAEQLGIFDTYLDVPGGFNPYLDQPSNFNTYKEQASTFDGAIELVNFDEAIVIELNARYIKADVVGVGQASSCAQNVGTFQLDTLATHKSFHVHGLARYTSDFDDLGIGLKRTRLHSSAFPAGSWKT